MKRAFLAFFWTLLFSGTVTAAPMVYTFSGIIYSINDSAGAVAQSGVDLAVGTPVEYVFIIDTEAPGESRLYDGTINIAEDRVDEDGDFLNYFYADLVSGSLIDEVNGGSQPTGPDNIAEYNFGIETIPPPPFVGYVVVVGGSPNNPLFINSSLPLDQWEVLSTPAGNGNVGQFGSDERASNATGQNSSIQAQLNLISITPVSIPVAIDIRPAGERNRVNLGWPRARVRVAVLGSAEFDATQVDYTTVTFGPADASPINQGRVRDVNADGFMDMVFRFRVADTGIACGDTEASLDGVTFAGQSFGGSDMIETVRCEP